MCLDPERVLWVGCQTSARSGQAEWTGHRAPEERKVPAQEEPHRLLQQLGFLHRPRLAMQRLKQLQPLLWGFF